MSNINTNKIINNILTERKIYIDLLLELLTVCKKTKEKLDMYYNNLHFYHSTVQTSVIIVTTGSTFLQSLLSGSLEDMIPIITLCISTYSSLILSLSKFFKLDERKEQVHNLRGRYTELNNKIRYNIDLLKPWRDKSYYSNLKEKITIWNTLIKQIESEYIIIIDTKKILFMEFEKIIDSLMWKKYTVKYEKKELKILNTQINNNDPLQIIQEQQQEQQQEQEQLQLELEQEQEQEQQLEQEQINP